MAGQEEGIIGRMVGGMIRRSVRHAFHSVLWHPPAKPIAGPVIFAVNHHGWHDGYLMFHVITKIGVRCLDWIAEYDAFPLFGKIGGMPFPPNDATRRGATVKRTIRLMREEGRSLVLFPEGTLHNPPKLLPFGRSLEVLASSVKGCQIVPVGIRYEMAMHERPQAFILLGDAMPEGPKLLERTRDSVENLLAEASFRLKQPESWEMLVKGTYDVNERWDMRRFRSNTSKERR